MASYCVVNPQVVSKATGETENSVLYSQIHKFTLNDYESAKRIYTSTINSEKFKEKENRLKSKLKYNEQGELELSSILENWDVTKMLPADFIVKLREQYNLNETKEGFTQKKWEQLEEACDNFNNSIYGKAFIATIDRKPIGINVNITPIHDNERANNTKNAISRQAQLNKMLRAQLNKWGIAIDALSDLEERLSNGVTDFTTAERSADGLIHLIRLAKGDRGEKALPEEFAHFVIRAMEDNPLVQRTLSLIGKYNLAESILGEDYQKYAEKYNNNPAMLAEEATGKLLKEHLFDAVSIDENASYKTLLERMMTAAKKMFSKYDENELIEAVNIVNENLSLIAQQALDENTELSPAKIRIGGILHDISQHQQQTNTIVKNIVNILNIERKRLAVLKATHSEKTQEQVEKLKNYLDLVSNYDAEYVITEFARNAYEEIAKSLTSLQNLREEGGNWKEKQHILRSLRNIVYSYSSIANEINEALITDTDFTQEDKAALYSIMHNLNSTFAQVMTELKTQSKDAFTEYMRSIFGDKITISDKEITVEDLVNMDVNDISFWDRWLDSAGESASYLIKAFDKAVKEKKTNARLRTTEVYKKIVALTKKLEQSGYSNPQFIYERDENGNQTGWYMSPINRTKYHNEKKAYEEQLRKELGENPDTFQIKAMQEKVRQWVYEHTEFNKEMQSYQPKMSLYRNTEYDKLTETQKQYLNDFLELKSEMDAFLPKNIDLYKTIKIRKDLLERVRSSHNPKTALHAFTDSLKDLVIYNSSDTDLAIKSALQDFEGKEIRTLPIFYTELGTNQTESDISMDAVSTLTAYAAMAIELNEMMEIVDILELGRDTVMDSKGPTKTIAGKPLVEKNGDVEMPIRAKNGGNIGARLNDWFESNVYHKYCKDEGALGKVSIAKAANTANLYSSTMQMGFNLLTGLSNVATGKHMMRVEAIGGQFFNYKDLLYADKRYAKEIVSFMGEIGSRVKTSWLALMDEKFNVMQNYDDEIANKDYDKKWYNKLFSTDSAFFMMKSGEHWMQNRTFLSLIHSQKEALKDSNGNKVLISDAYTTQNLIPGNPQAGARVVLRKGLKYKDGRTIITMEQLQERADQQHKQITDKSLLKEGEMSETEFINKISRKSAFINNQMHGIYNKEDRNAFQRTSIGRLVIMYRKWVKPSLNRRFKAGQYNFDVEDYVEGYYATTWRFIKQLAKDIKMHQLNISEMKGKMTETEKANLKKAFGEIALYLVLTLLTGLLFDDDDDDKKKKKKDKSFALNMVEYQMRRLKTEVGVLLPAPSMLYEGLKIAQSPAASVKTGANLLDLTEVLWIPNWFDKVERGRFKDYPRPVKEIMDVIPYEKTIYRSLHPDENIQWLKTKWF